MSACAMDIQLHENRTFGLGQRIDPRSQSDRIGVISNKRVTDAKPNVKIPEQVFGGDGEIGEIYGHDPGPAYGSAFAVILHAAAGVELSSQGHRKAQFRQVVRGVFKNLVRVVISRLLESVAGGGLEPMERPPIDFDFDASGVDLATILILN